MEGNFEINQIGYYTVEMVGENDFINSKNSEGDLAKFGKTYSVKFKGDAETFMWTTKTEPEVGKKYYGHLQPTSGKSIRFKTDKKEDNAPVPKDAASNFESVDKQDAISRSVALNNAIALVGGSTLVNDKLNNGDNDELESIIIGIADRLYSWLRKDDLNTKDVGNDPINLNDIPF